MNEEEFLLYVRNTIKNTKLSFPPSPYCSKCEKDNKRMLGLKKYGNYCPKCWEKVKPIIRTLQDKNGKFITIKK